MKATKALVRGAQLWAVSLGKKEGLLKRARVFGSTKEEAERRAREKLSEKQLHGSGLADISHTHRAIIVEWRDRLTPEEMVAALSAFDKGRGCTRLVRDCVADYVATKTKPDGRGKAPWSREQAKPSASRLKRFLAGFGERVLGELTPGEVEDFVTSQGASASNYHRTLRALFGHARRHRWIAKSPFEEMAGAPHTEGGEGKDLLTPALFAKLLRIAAGIEEGHARREPLLAALVLGGLAGLRTAEVQRLKWGAVDLVAGRLSLGRDTTRKRGLRGRVVELEPAALAWLRTLTPGEAGERVVKLTDKNFRDARTAIAKAAGLKTWPDNVLRRSFASHHLPFHETGAKTAYVMGHTDAGTTFAKYRVPATRQAGEEWFAILPSETTSPAGSSETRGAPASFAAACADLSQSTGFPAVMLSEILAATGAKLPELHAWTRAEHHAGRVVLSIADWSLATRKQRAAALAIGSERYLQVRLLPQDAA